MRGWWRPGQRGGGDAIVRAFRMAGTTGLSLTGPGAVPAARALILHALSGSGLGLDGQVVVAQSDLDLLLGSPFSRASSAAVVVTATPEAALDYTDAYEGRALLVVCTAEPALARRARALSGPGSTIKVVLLGADGGREVDVSDAEWTEGPSNRRLSTAGRDELHALRMQCGYLSTSTERKHLVLRVLGPVRLEVWDDGERRDITHMLTLKQRELLVFLAVAREDGAHRAMVNQAIWPGSPSNRPYNSLHNALSRLRRTISDASGGVVRDIVVHSGVYYRINQDLVDVDYWRFRSSDRDLLTLYRGDVGEGIDAVWLDLPREASRHLMYVAVNITVESSDGVGLHAALSALKNLRPGDPYNERIYRDTVRIQLKLGRVDEARQTLELLEKVLAEIDREPGASTRSILSSG